MQKINLIYKGFCEEFNEPTTVISVISCKNTVARVFKQKITVLTSPKLMENQVKIYLWILKSHIFRFKNYVVHSSH